MTTDRRGAGASPPPLRGKVESTLPRGLFSVRTSEGTIVAGIGREAVHLVRVKPGDFVDVRVSPRDPTRGRIVALAGNGAR